MPDQLQTSTSGSGNILVGQWFLASKGNHLFKLIKPAVSMKSHQWPTHSVYWGRKEYPVWTGSGTGWQNSELLGLHPARDALNDSIISQPALPSSTTGANSSSDGLAKFDEQSLTTALLARRGTVILPSSRLKSYQLQAKSFCKN